MKYLKFLFSLMCLAFLASCGGGGGSAGINSNIPVPTLYTTAPSTLAITLGASQVYTIGGGNPPYAATSSNQSVLVAAVNGTTMTLGAVASGSATVSIVDAKGSSLSLTVTVPTPSVTQATPTVSVALTSASGTALATPVTLLTGTNYTASATVLNANNAPVPNQLVQFAATTTTNSSGTAVPLVTLYPTSALTNSKGVASVEVTPLSVAGAASIQATSTLNGTPYPSAPASFQVVPSSTPAAMSFVSATPSIIVVNGASSGTTLSNVIFSVVNAQGVGVTGQPVVLSLNQQSIAAGVTFFVNGANTNAAQTLTTDASGQVYITVASGSLPTPILVTATSATNANIKATSVGLAVTNGRPTQLRSSIAANPISVEASNGGTSVIAGVQSTITVYLSDRLGNPIPKGTVVNLVTNYGQISGSCVVAIVSNASQCQATWTSVAKRPSDGFFTVLAYLDGEEDFIDSNGNNQYDAGESFVDVGEAYLPADSASTSYQAATDQPISGGMTGNSTCTYFGAPYANPPQIPYQILNTCDGVWSSSIRVREGVTLNWSSTKAVLTQTYNATDKMTIQVANDQGNSMPGGSKLSVNLTCPASVQPVPTVTLSQTVTPDSLAPLSVDVYYSANVSQGSLCTVAFTVTTPGGVVTLGNFKTI